MDIGTFFIANTQTPPLKKPIKESFHHIAVDAKAAAMLGVALSNDGNYAQTTQGLSNLGFRIVSAISKQMIGMSPGTSARIGNGRDGLDQGHGPLRVMHVSAGVFDNQRGTVAVGQHMALRAIFASVCGVRASLCPPKTARTEQLSMMAVDQSIPPALPSESRRSFHIFVQTPWLCQSRSRRQQVMPEPQPISSGKYSHGVPDFKTKRMPVRQARSETRGLPPFGLGGSTGSRGWIRSHNASGKSALAIMSSMTGLTFNPTRVYHDSA
jgi:hypothetical protein